MALTNKIISLRMLSKLSQHFNSTCTVPTILCSRQASYKTSPEYDPNSKIEYEVSKNPEEWKFVNRLFPPKSIPKPVTKESYPSGWLPQKAPAFEMPYYLRRTRNHMLPVHLKATHRNTCKVTRIKHIEGDIWLFEKHLREHLQKFSKFRVGIRVDEVAGKLVLKGDHVNNIKNWLLSLGL